MSDCDDGSISKEPEVAWVDDFGEVREQPDTVLSIVNVAKMFNVTQLTLRYYERRGLIARRHYVGRTRVYGWADCDRIAFIIKGRRVGLSLGEMAVMLKAADHDAAVESMEAGRATCLDLIDRLDQRRALLRDALAELRHLHTLLARKLIDDDADRD